MWSKLEVPKQQQKNADFLVITGNEGNDKNYKCMCISTNSHNQLDKGQKFVLVILLLLWFRLCFRYSSRHSTPPTVIPTRNSMRHIATNTPLFMWSSYSDNWSAKKHRNKTQYVVLIRLKYSHIFIGSYLQSIEGQIQR